LLVGTEQAAHATARQSAQKAAEKPSPDRNHGGGILPEDTRDFRELALPAQGLTSPSKDAPREAPGRFRLVVGEHVVVIARRGAIQDAGTGVASGLQDDQLDALRLFDSFHDGVVKHVPCRFSHG
jgi:hypothetical protein